MDTASYYVIVASAGHDTTKDAISGGLRALIDNPGELDRLRNDPSLMGTAVEEMIRWSTPVKEFMRTATADTTVRGVDIAKGESVYLAYVSGNRDEEVFTDPFRFDVSRDPNKHVVFRLRRALLSGCRTGPDGDEQPLHRADPAPRLDRIGRRARAFRHHVRRRPQAPSDSLRTAVTPSGPDPFAKHVRKPSTAATAAA